MVRCAFVALIGMFSLSSAFAADSVDKSAPVEPASSSFFLFQDTSVSYWHQFNAAEPGVGRGIQKDIVSLTHFDAWQYGTNFFNIDFLKSDDDDPSRSGDGAFEVYGLFRSTLSLNAMSGTKTFEMEPLKDVSLYFGADANTKNTDFDPQKRDFVAGLQFSFPLYDKGYFNIAPVYYKEWNHNGITNTDVEFDGTFKLEADYAQPLGDLPLTFKGYINVTAPKGADGFGAQTKTEFHTENRLVLDIGKLVSDKSGLVDIYIGHSYWQNKFGSNHRNDLTGGSTENAFFVGITGHISQPGSSEIDTTTEPFIDQ